jgi:hypothetical protein
MDSNRRVTTNDGFITVTKKSKKLASRPQTECGKKTKYRILHCKGATGIMSKMLNKSQGRPERRLMKA